MCQGDIFHRILVIHGFRIVLPWLRELVAMVATISDAPLLNMYTNSLIGSKHGRHPNLVKRECHLVLQLLNEMSAIGKNNFHNNTSGRGGVAPTIPLLTLSQSPAPH